MPWWVYVVFQPCVTLTSIPGSNGRRNWVVGTLALAANALEALAPIRTAAARAATTVERRRVRRWSSNRSPGRTGSGGAAL